MVVSLNSRLESNKEEEEGPPGKREGASEVQRWREINKEREEECYRGSLLIRNSPHP